MSACKSGNGLVDESLELRVTDRYLLISVIERLSNADFHEDVSGADIYGPDVVVSPVEGRITMSGVDRDPIIADVGGGHDIKGLCLAVVGPHDPRTRLEGQLERGEQNVKLVGLGDTNHLGQTYLVAPIERQYKRCSHHPGIVELEVRLRAHLPA